MATKPAATKPVGARTGAVPPLKDVQRVAMQIKQVSDPNRIRILLALDEGERHVGALCEAVGQSQPATSHHLALLRHGGVIAPRRQGKNNFYGLTPLGERLASVVKSVNG